MTTENQERQSDHIAVANETIPAEAATDDGTNIIVGTPTPTLLSSIRLHGAPLQKLPHDLYIPPDALKILLDEFEGPLDLLLYLIRKQDFDIFDIPVAQVTQQFLVYVEEIRLISLETASDYLVMAAMLINIKSRMLLPKTESATDDIEEDPRAELARKLIEYEQMKLASVELDRMPQVGRDVFVAEVAIEKLANLVPPTVHPDDLQRAFADILTRARMVQHHQIRREELSVRQHMTNILRKLQEKRFVEFSEMFEAEGGVPVVVVNFVAMLELAKETLVQITQAEPFAPIYVSLSQSHEKSELAAAG